MKEVKEGKEGEEGEEGKGRESTKPKKVNKCLKIVTLALQPATGDSATGQQFNSVHKNKNKKLSKRNIDTLERLFVLKKVV